METKLWQFFMVLVSLKESALKTKLNNDQQKHIYVDFAKDNCQKTFSLKCFTKFTITFFSQPDRLLSNIIDISYKILGVIIDTYFFD